MRDIKGYEGLYGITSCGRVWSYRSNKFLKPRKSGWGGYLCVGLYKNGKQKTFLISKLVAEAYIPNPQKLETVEYLDGNKEHNYINNLRWYDEHRRWAPRPRIHCIETGRVYDTINDAARELCLSAGRICKNCGKKGKRVCDQYHWEYVD